MTDNRSMKRKLIMQSFAPLFFILVIKYFDCSLGNLMISFGKRCMQEPGEAVWKAVNHDMFLTVFFEVFCLVWIGVSIYGIRAFTELQKYNFSSQGESLTEIQKISESGVTFFMTYVLPMAMDDLNTIKGLSVFVVLMVMLFVLMWKTNLYYQNPILTILGYEVFSFKFETTQVEEFKNVECIGIRRGKVREKHSIKRQRISDNVFLVYEER